MEKVKGYIARDAFMEELCLYSDKPYRNSDGLGIWKMNKGGIIRLPKEIFPDLKWEDEPMMVEIMFAPIKQPTSTSNDMTEKEIFKKKLYDLLFESTRTEELSVERLFEIVDAIADDVLHASKQTGL